MTDFEERERILAKEIKTAKIMFGGGILGLTAYIGVFTWQLAVALFLLEMMLYGLLKLDDLGVLNL